MTNPCKEHGERIAKAETHVENINTTLQKVLDKIDILYKHLWLGIGILVALNFVFNSSIVGKVLMALSNTAYAIMNT